MNTAYAIFFLLALFILGEKNIKNIYYDLSPVKALKLFQDQKTWKKY